jgi:hypothetical protein
MMITINQISKNQNDIDDRYLLLLILLLLLLKLLYQHYYYRIYTCGGLVKFLHDFFILVSSRVGRSTSPAQNRNESFCVFFAFILKHRHASARVDFGLLAAVGPRHELSKR